MGKKKKKGNRNPNYSFYKFIYLFIKKKMLTQLGLKKITSGTYLWSAAMKSAKFPLTV